MSSYDNVCKRFAERGRPLKAGNVFADESMIYSYGHHFPMAIALDDQRTFVLNGDRYSVTTSGHQSMVRSACQSTDWATIILPFSALRAAGIMAWRMAWRSRLSDFTPLEVIQDRIEWKCEQCGIGWTPGYGEHWGHEGYTSRHRLGASVFKANDQHYLSAFDETAVNRWGAGFFLVRLPVAATTCEEALESLKPPEVVEAVRDGLEVKRQGDIFAIPTEIPTRRLPGPSLHMAQLLEQNHVATEVRITEVRATFARGSLYHKPRRRPEHRRIPLGTAWHRIIRNLGQGSWAAQGYVD